MVVDVTHEGHAMLELDRMIIDKPADGIFRVHRSAMTSLEILQMEQERIFNKCWLYLCHESEVENPGEYRRRFRMPDLPHLRAA